MANEMRMLRLAPLLVAVACGGAKSEDSGTSEDAISTPLLVYAPTGKDSAQNPAFSPDGSTVLFTIWHGGYNIAPAGLYTIPFASGARSTVLNEDASDVNLPGTSWNAATHRITFASDHVDGPDEIFTSDPDGRNLARVTHHSSGGPYIEPSFSPDGKQIVFERDLSDTKAELWITGADGAGLRRLTMGSDDREPNWSPDGSKILFQRRTADWAIYTINPDGTGVFQVTPSAWSSTDASWSPDSKRIVYSAGNSTIAGANIFVIGALGGAPTRVTTSGGYDGAVSWSPDGQWLAFESSSNPSGEAVTRIMKVRAPPIE